MKFVQRNHYQPSKYTNVGSTCAHSSSRVRQRPLSFRDQNAVDRFVLEQQETKYKIELFQRNNTLKKERLLKEQRKGKNDTSQKHQQTTNIRNQNYRFKLSFDDWLTTKKKTRKNPSSTSSSSSSLQSSLNKNKQQRPSEQKHSIEFQRWLKEDNRKRRKERKRRERKEREKLNDELGRMEKRNELHQIHLNREKEERLKNIRKQRKRKELLKISLLNERKSQEERKRLHDKDIQRSYNKWLERKRREKTMIQIVQKTAVERREKGGRPTVGGGGGGGGLGGLTNLEDALNLDDMYDAMNSSSPPSPIPMLSYGGISKTARMKLPTNRYVRYVDRNEEVVVVNEKEENEEEDPYDIVDDLLEQSVESLGRKDRFI
jgi:hypothetical protein